MEFSISYDSFEAIRYDYAEKNALLDKKEAEIIDPLRAETREMLDKLDAMKAVLFSSPQFCSPIASPPFFSQIAYLPGQVPHSWRRAYPPFHAFLLSAGQ